MWSVDSRAGFSVAPELTGSPFPGLACGEPDTAGALETPEIRDLRDDDVVGPVLRLEHHDARPVLVERPLELVGRRAVDEAGDHLAAVEADLYPYALAVRHATPPPRELRGPIPDERRRPGTRTCTASSRSATATPTWWIPRASTRAMLPPVGRVGLREPLRGVLRRRDDLRHADRLGRPRLRFDAGEELDHLVADEGLLLEQQAGQPVERAAVLLEQANGLGVRGVGETSLLLVAQTLRGLRQGVVVGAQRPRRDAVGHAPFEDHRPGDLGHLLEIVCGAVRDASEDDLLCGPAGEGDDH